MKKFLSILLALAVGFTFTFGSAMSAFAAAPAAANTYTQAEAEKAITDAATDAINAVKTDLATVEKGLNDIPASGYFKTKVSREAQIKVLEEYVADILTSIETQRSMKLSALRTAIAAAGTDYVACTTESATTGYVNFNTTYDVSGFDASYKLTSPQLLKACEEDLELVKAATIKAIQAIDVTAYSTTVKSGTGKTYQDIAKERINNAIAVINVISVKTADNTSARVTAKTKLIQDIYVKGVTEAAGDTGFLVAANEAESTVTIDTVDYKITSINGLLKVKDETAEAGKLEYAKKAAITAVESKVAADKGTAIAALQSKIAAEQAKDKPDTAKIAGWNDEIKKATDGAAAQIEVMTYRINAVKNSSSLVDSSFNVLPAWTTLTTSSSGKLVTVEDALKTVANIEKLKAEAELAKATIGIDGTTYAEIDKALEKAIKDEYTAVGTGNFSWTTTDDIIAAEKEYLIKGDTAGTAIKVNKINYTAVNGWNMSLFNKDQYDAFRALVKETIDAINEAKTSADADAAFLAGWAKLDAMTTTAEQTAMFNPGGALYKNYTDYVAQIKAYVDYKLALIETKENPADSTILKGSLVDSLKDGVYTSEALDKAFADAKAFVDNLKTVTQLKADKAALEAEVIAVKTPLTVADKEAVNALADKIAKHNEYIDMFSIATTWDVDDSLIGSYVNIIKNAEAKAIKDAYDAIYKDNKVTLDEKDQVLALVKAYEDYLAYYTPENADAAEITTVEGTVAYTKNQITAAKTAIDTLEIDNVAAIIAKLPAAADITAADKAAVEAARAAYDALSKEAKAKYSEPTKLIVAEQILANVTKLTAEEAKAYVQDLSIAVRTAKVGKKVKVTVNADVQKLVDNGYTVTYKFYKSTKKSSGYKNTVNKTTNTYTNTNPVKGKNYYKVKLVVKNAEGTVVATTPLTQCKYGVRTIK